MQHFKEQKLFNELSVDMFSKYIKNIYSKIYFFENYSKDRLYNFGYADMYAFSGTNSKYFYKNIDAQISRERKIIKTMNFIFGEKNILSDKEIHDKIIDKNSKKSFSYFVKYNQSWRYIIAVIKEYDNITISIRRFWNDIEMIQDDYRYEHLKNKSDFKSQGELSLVFSEYADDSFTEFSKRPSLNYILENGFKYLDARDIGYIADFKIKNAVIEVENGFDYNSLISVLLDLDIIIEEN